jgi:hypothetical protein
VQLTAADDLPTPGVGGDQFSCHPLHDLLQLAVMTLFDG